MKKMSEPISFFGSGTLAAASLKLLAANFKIEAVITKPWPSHHKTKPPVIELSEQLNLKTYTAKDQAELVQLFLSKPVKSRLAVLIDYGIIVEKSIIDYFPLGIVNSHFSLLPRWRGADPISFAILNGDESTGVSLMLLVPELDEGPLLAQRSLKIDNSSTTPILTNKLIVLSQSLLEETLPAYLNGQVKAYPQETKGVSYSRKLEKFDSWLDWQKPADYLERQIRAFIEWPRSRAKLGDQQLIVTKAHVEAGSGQIGSIWRSDQQFGVYTARDILVIDELIPPGKPAMTAVAYLAGHQL